MAVELDLTVFFLPMSFFPLVEDSTICHSHSEVPIKQEDWPVLKEILAYKDKVNQRISDIYNDFATGKTVLNRRLARMFWMVWEQ